MTDLDLADLDAFAAARPAAFAGLHACGAF